MTSLESEQVVRLCAARAGLRIDPDKAYLVESRLGPVARREGYGSIAELMTAVRSQGEERLIWAVVEAMASADTGFFRDRPVFEQLVRELVPEIAVRKAGQPVRVWSAACSTGQEIYSLAMLHDDVRMAGVTMELFASDLGDRLLDKAQSGAYSQFEVQRGLAARELVQHFEKQDDTFVLSRRIRQQVRWRRVNLVDDLSRLGRFDVVMCRYAVSGLTDEARVRVLQSLAACVQPEGYLVLGLGESADDIVGLEPVANRRGVYQPSRRSRAVA